MGRYIEMSAWKVTDCDSSGSEHSMLDLSHLVNSFIENNDNIDDSKMNEEECTSDNVTEHDMEEMEESLKTLFRYGNGDDDLLLQVQKASDNSLFGSKRGLMARLRHQGLDAGVCKSKWEKKGKLISGDYEYVDVNVEGTRYIINVSLRDEFEIAKPTNGYSSLLNILPQISVTKVEEFKDIIKIMSKAVKKSMSQVKMTLPPWRRREYVQAKWFASYKRTTNEFPSKKIVDDKVIINKKTIGFRSIPCTSYGRYKENFGSKDFGFKMGYLAIAMNE